MDGQSLRCSKCEKKGILIIASIREADQPIVVCADHLVELAHEKQVEAQSAPEDAKPPTSYLSDCLQALRDARLARLTAIQNTIESESLTRTHNHAQILSDLEKETAQRKK